MPRSDTLHLVGLVKDDEIILEQDADFHYLVEAAQQRKKQRVVEHQHVGGKNALARALKEADAVLLAEFRLVAANLGRTKTALRANVRPDLGVGLNVEVRQTAVLGGLGPFVNALELLRLGRGEEAVGLLHRLVKPAGAEIIATPLEHGVAELDREDFLQHGQVLL